MPSAFYKHVCSKDNYLHLNDKNVLYTKVFETNYFLEVHARKKYGFGMKSTFHIVFKACKDETR